MTSEGKGSWPELVGVKGERAAAIIERQNPYVEAWILREDDVTDAQLRCDRVKVRVNGEGIVVQIPRIG